jgi:putative sugar O-methyltransferase
MKPNFIIRGLNAALREVEIRWRVSGFVTPSSCQRLSDAEFDRAKLICGDIRALVDGRTRYIEENGLDPEFCLPGANWKGDWEWNQLYRGTAALLREDYDNINNLRLFSQVFTGYSLIDMKDARETKVPGRVPHDLEERMLHASRRVDTWVRRYWSLARCTPDYLHLSQPKRFGEAGWIYSGKLVNHDTCVYMERIALLHAAGLLDRLGAQSRNPLILEIGGGYGGLAYHLKKRAPQARYVIVDIPESLVFSAIYLGTLFPDQRNVLVTSPEAIARDLDQPGFTFVPNHFCHRFEASGIRVDLAINTLSMSEMLVGQVAAYCELIRKCLVPGGVFFEQNQDSRHLGLLNAELHIAEFFKHRRQISLPTYLVSGSPNIWSP